MTGMDSWPIARPIQATGNVTAQIVAQNHHAINLTMHAQNEGGNPAAHAGVVSGSGMDALTVIPAV